jgi:2-methylcitrate dehydratase
MTLAEELSGYAYQLRFKHLPKEVRHEVIRRLIDAMGCAMGAIASAPAQITRCVAGRVRDPKGATLLGTRHMTSPDLAAFHNGTLIRYLDYNDTYLSKEPAHPSDNISAALALAECLHLSGKDLITAIVLGYEIQCRLCDAASIRARGWDHVTYGAFSTALLASKLLDFSQEKMKNALGLAGVTSAALRQTRVGELSMWKGCAFANAARNGVFAALLAEEGMTGPSPIFEGKLGFFNLVSGPFRLGPLGGSKVPFKITGCSIKFFPAEYHAQSAIEAALQLRSQISDFDEIQSIRIKTFRTAVEIIGGEPEKWHPVSRETADHSLPYCVAVALIDGKVGLDQFSDRRIRDPYLQRLIQKVTVEEDPRLTKQYPKSIPTELILSTKSGAKIRKKIIAPRGHALNPMHDDEIERKFKSLTDQYFSTKRQKRILDTLWNLEEMKDTGEIMPLFVIREVSK